ncbi:MAG: tat pathway signal sequence domain protein [Hyphomicrobiaceae bacterium]|nr:tat pathway signal sequence domain protein [Hyphomicrobiaceae bacterium]
MSNTSNRFIQTAAVISALVITAALAMTLPDARAEKRTATVFTGIVEGTALAGYDAVAYFSEGKPVAGSPDFTLHHAGATWRFASAANRDSFAASPDKFAPQYGGHCAWAVGQGYTAKGDPKAWRIVDGKLYLNYDQKVQRTWEADIPGNIGKADRNWPKISTN